MISRRKVGETPSKMVVENPHPRARVRIKALILSLMRSVEIFSQPQGENLLQQSPDLSNSSDLYFLECKTTR